jgi:hypothetical protein
MNGAKERGAKRLMIMSRLSMMVRFMLSQIIMERMQLKNKPNLLSYSLRKDENQNFQKEIDRILDRLKYLEKLEETIKKYS